MGGNDLAAIAKYIENRYRNSAAWKMVFFLSLALPGLYFYIGGIFLISTISSFHDFIIAFIVCPLGGLLILVGTMALTKY